MSERKRTMEIRGVPHNTAFVGTIWGNHGLWWRDKSGVYALDVKDAMGTRVAFSSRPSRPFYDASVTEITDYQGPVDILIKVRGFSPWRGKDKDRIGQSHVRVEYAKPKDYSKGPRAVRLRDDDE